MNVSRGEIENTESNSESCGDGGTVLAMPMCPCERGPKRKGQNNCNRCNVEANKKYRQRKKEHLAHLERIRLKFAAYAKTGS